MPFGQYRGRLVSDCPADYLRWLIEHIALSGRLDFAVRTELMRQGYFSEPKPDE
jgi:uncharacterized protein (DUF3820 family)